MTAIAISGTSTIARILTTMLAPFFSFRRLASSIPVPFSPLICSLLTSSVINKATSFVPLTVHA